jgi:hypothetical protein
LVQKAKTMFNREVETTFDLNVVIFKNYIFDSKKTVDQNDRHLRTKIEQFFSVDVKVVK